MRRDKKFENPWKKRDDIPLRADGSCLAEEHAAISRRPHPRLWQGVGPRLELRRPPMTRGANLFHDAGRLMFLAGPRRGAGLPVSELSSCGYFCVFCGTGGRRKNSAPTAVFMQVSRFYRFTKEGLATDQLGRCVAAFGTPANSFPQALFCGRYAKGFVSP